MKQYNTLMKLSNLKSIYQKKMILEFFVFYITF